VRALVRLALTLTLSRSTGRGNKNFGARSNPNPYDMRRTNRMCGREPSPCPFRSTRRGEEGVGAGHMQLPRATAFVN
jgi:hypothetical protein